MSSIFANLPDTTTFAANVVVFLAAIAATVAGSLSAIKKIKEGWLSLSPPAPAPVVTQTQVVGGLLQDAIGSAMMSEQLRATNANLAELCNQVRETRILMERMIDRMDRRHD